MTIVLSHRLVGLSIVIIICIGALNIVSRPTANPPLHTPVGNPTATHPTHTSPLTVYGFLPYWNIRKIHTLPSSLTHIALFGIPIVQGGQLDTAATSYTPFWKPPADWIHTAARSQALQVDLTITLFDDVVAQEILQSEPQQARLRKELTSLLKSHPTFSGINLDVEYTGSQSAQLQERFTQFVQTLANDVHTSLPSKTITVSVYANAIDGTNIWNIPALAPVVDRIVVMGYDFHRASSTFAGPVAPLLDLSQTPEKNIASYLQKYLAIVPATKLILGVPFYGYEWQTISDDPRAATYPRTGSTASYARIQEIEDNQSQYAATLHWDDQTLSPYLKYRENGKQKMIYYENAQSLTYKLDFVRQTELGGIGIWALGYEGDDQRLWQAISTALSSTSSQE